MSTGGISRVRQRKRMRLYTVLIALALLATAVGLVLYAFRENIVFFVSPAEIAERGITPGQRFRLGGLVEVGSIERDKDGLTIRFKVTDLRASVPVRYRGLLPDLFHEGKGVVTEGRLGEDGVFIADSVLAKHDENYMPPEVAESLRKSGLWEDAKPAENKEPEELKEPTGGEN